MAGRRKNHGFTLIELMVTLTVVVVLLVVALPSFFQMRQRAALRGAADEVESVWNQARFESAKRNQMVKFGVSTSGSKVCLGAATTTNKDDSTPCDCFTAGACDVAAFPADQSEWRSVSLAGTPTMGDDTGVVVLDSKRSALTDSADAGGLTLNGPPGGYSYKLSFMVDQFGRGYLCEPSTATAKMSDYSNRRCNL